MRSNKKSLSERRAVRVQLYRLLCLLGAALILLFGILYEWTNPQATDPAWARITFVGVTLGLTGASYLSRIVRRYFVTLTWAVLYVMMAWITVLSTLNNFSSDYVVGLLVIYASSTVVIVLGARSIAPVFAFLGTGLVFVVGGILAAPALQTSPPIIIAGLSTVVLAEGISLWGQFSDREALAEQERQLRAIAENVSDGIYRSTPNDGLVFVNQAFVEMFGYESPREVSKVDSASLYADPDERRRLARALETKGGFDGLEVQFRRKDGTTFTGLLSGTVVRDEDGNVQYYDGAITDITQLKRHRRALQKRRRKLEALYSATDRLLRASTQEEVGQVLTELIQDTLGHEGISVRFVKNGYLEPSQIADSTSEFMPERPAFDIEGESIAAQVYRTGETVVVRDTGETPIEDPHDYGDLRSAAILPLGKHGVFSVASPAPNALGNFDTHLIEVLGTYATVVLDRLQQERALRSAKKQAERARAQAVRASEAKSAFLANMSHEIRTPLTSIIGFAGAISEETQALKDCPDEADLSKLGRFSGLIKKGGKRLLDTLDAVLNLSKLESGQMELAEEEVDLVEKVWEIAEEFRPSTQEKDLSLDIEAEAETLSARVDEGGVQIVLQNLLSNAIKYTDEGGVEVGIYESGGEAVLQVEDTGIGMGSEVAESLFEPFRQASEGLTRKYEGTGVGLAVTKKAVEQMGGQIDVESEQGEGSRFFVRLPLAEADRDQHNTFARTRGSEVSSPGADSPPAPPEGSG